MRPEFIQRLDRDRVRKAAPIAAAALALLFCGLLLLRTRTPSPRFARELTMIDATSGDVVRIDVSRRGVVIPGANPRTGKATLLPAERGADGAWYISERYRGALDQVEGAPAAVDPETGRVGRRR